jgi:hypothetical protein
MVREIRRAKINPKSSFKNYGVQNTQGRKLCEQIRYVLLFHIVTPYVYACHNVLQVNACLQHRILGFANKPL